MDKKKKVSRIIMSSVILALLVFGLVLIITTAHPDQNLISHFFNTDVDIINKIGSLPFVIIVVLLIVAIVKMVKVVIAYATSKGDLVKMNSQIKSSANTFIICFVLAIAGAMTQSTFYLFTISTSPNEDYIMKLAMGGYAAAGYYLLFMIASLILSSILRKGNKQEYDATHVLVEQAEEKPAE